MPAEIIDGSSTSYIETTIPVVMTVAQLRLYPKANNATWAKGPALVLRLGDSEAFDADYGLYAWDPASTAADDGGATIKPTAIAVDAALNATGAGRWIRVLTQT